jgi:ribonuclease HIII
LFFLESNVKMNAMSCFVATIDLSLAQKLRKDLLDQGFELSTPIHTLFSAQKKGVSCTLYQSGKLTVQGKEKDEFIKFYLEPEILGTFGYSYPETEADLTPHIGIDEAGKGDFFGPLCIAGVQADEAMIKELLKIGVRDSKTMGDPAILTMSKKIRLVVPYSIVRLGPPKYNELYGKFHNLNRLLAWGHATAIAELVEKTGCKKVLIDQFAGEHLVLNALKQKQLTVDLTQRHGGESDPVVAAASILARAAFLDGMKFLSEEVNFELPKGASKQVVQAGKALVRKYGPGILQTVGKLHFKTKDEILNDTLFP